MARRTSSRKRVRRETPRVSATRNRRTQPGRRKRNAPRIRPPKTLGVSPAWVVLAVGLAGLAWQFVVLPGYPGLAEWLPGKAAGMAGLLAIGAGLVLLWLEGAGFRDRL